MLERRAVTMKDMDRATIEREGSLVDFFCFEEFFVVCLLVSKKFVSFISLNRLREKLLFVFVVWLNTTGDCV